MRFAYADPPYPGKARTHYGDHPDFGGEVDHRELVDRLETEFDGWALSTSAKALPYVLSLCPPMEPNPKQPGDFKSGTGVRVLSWHKRVGQPGTRDLTNVWEPVIIRNYRRPAIKGPRPNDALVCPPELFTMRARPEGHVTGAKPPGFCRWIFECAGLETDDEFVDVFPGSGSVLREWEIWRREERIALSHPLDHSGWAREDLRRNHPQLEGIETPTTEG